MFDNAGNSYVFSRLYEFDTTDAEFIRLDQYHNASSGYKKDGMGYVNVQANVNDDPLSGSDSTASRSSIITYVFGIYDKWMTNTSITNSGSTTIDHNIKIDLSKIHVMFSRSANLYGDPSQNIILISGNNGTCSTASNLQTINTNTLETTITNT